MCPVMSSKISHSTIPHAPSPENACSKCSELGVCEYSWEPGAPGTPWLITSPRTCCVEQVPVPLRFVLCKSIMDSPSANARIGSRCSTIHAIESWLKCHPHVTMGVCVCVILQGEGISLPSHLAFFGGAWNVHWGFSAGGSSCSLLPVTTKCGTGFLPSISPKASTRTRTSVEADFTGDLEATIGAYVFHLTALMGI